MMQFVLAICLTIGISAICSFLEAVLYTTPASTVEVLARSGRKSGEALRRLKADMQRPITAVLTLNTIANTMGAAVAGALATAVLGEELLTPFSACFTLAILIFSEILPKTAGVAFAKTWAPIIALPLELVVRLLTPFIVLTKLVTKLIPKSSSSSYMASAEEIQAIAMLSRRAGAIDPQQEKVITNILELKNKTVRQAMTPRTVTYIMSEILTVEEAMLRKEEWARHSRIPVYARDPEDVVGIVMGKDILLATADGHPEKQLSAIMHEVHFVPESAPLDKILMQFFEKHQHLFVVVDEYGSVTGVISLEDVIEEIVGREIVDESDLARDMRELARKKKLFASSRPSGSGNPEK